MTVLEGIEQQQVSLGQYIPKLQRQSCKERETVGHTATTASQLEFYRLNQHNCKIPIVLHSENGLHRNRIEESASMWLIPYFRRKLVAAALARGSCWHESTNLEKSKKVTLVSA